MNKYTCYYTNDFGDHYTAFDKADENGEWYRASEVDAKFKEYDDDNLALSQTVTKLDARIAKMQIEIDAVTRQRDETYAKLVEAREKIQQFTFGSNR